jgi:hypothetical protein
MSLIYLFLHLICCFNLSKVQKRLGQENDEYVRPELINRQAQDELNKLRMEATDDSSFINIILPAAFGRAALMTQHADLKPLRDRIKRSERYVAIRGKLKFVYEVRTTIKRA